MTAINRIAFHYPVDFFGANEMIKNLTPPIRAIILDMDGVLYRGPVPIGNLPEIFDTLHAMGLKWILCTNNATRHVDAVQEKMAGYGVHVEYDQILTSGQAAAYLLKKKHPQGGPVFIVGEEGIRAAMEEQGFYSSDQKPLAVVAGLDRTVNYEKLRMATLFIRSGIPFIGSNPDASFPSPEGLIPGAGSILAAIQVASGVEPLIAGKPMPALFQAALERLGTRPEDTLVVGDRLDTDILGGQRAGCRTAVVLSGVSSLEEVERWTPAPDLIAPSLSHLLFEKVNEVEV